MEPTQDQPLKMEKVVKEETDDQNDESRRLPDLQPVAETPGCSSPLTQSQQGSAPVPLGQQEQGPHETHSFEWSAGDGTFKMTCNETTTVEKLLNKSPQFRKNAKKNKNKELVVVSDGKAISSHFPCYLIRNERLAVKYIKAADKSEEPVSGSVDCQRMESHGKPVTFHVRTKGSKNIAKILRNPALKTTVNEMTVYAYKGETVMEALKRDGRFLNLVFRKNCALSHTITEVTTEMNDLVDDLNGETFMLKLLKKGSPPNSQPGSLDDANMMQNESERSDRNGDQDPPQPSATTESVNDNTTSQKPKIDDDTATDIMPRVILKSEKMRRYLSSQIQDLVKGKNVPQGSMLSHIQNLFCVEYGNNAQTCKEVKTMKKLMDLGDSVCQVRVNGTPVGSGFLLFDKFVLTNAHVIKDIYDASTRQLNERVTVHFSFESVDDGGPYFAVEEVAGFEHSNDVSGRMHDWALLRLSADETLPEVLLPCFGPPGGSGGICIIGHPGGGVKKVDPCVIVPTGNRDHVVERHRLENPQGVLPHNSPFPENQESLQMITHRFFEGVKNDSSTREALCYESCFYFGSSGSPVFDKHCNVVAVHTGGYFYGNAKGELKSVIEYGYPLSVIIVHIIVQMVVRGMFEVLKKFLACSDAHQGKTRSDLKKLVESRNLVALAFQHAADDPVVKNDENLKEFFDFLFQREEPTSMDTD